MNVNGPVRTCAACRTRRPQGALVRMALRKDGTINIDVNRKRSPGRGAYICPDEKCILLAERRQSFRRSFRVEIPAQCYAELRHIAESWRVQE